MLPHHSSSHGSGLRCAQLAISVTKFDLVMLIVFNRGENILKILDQHLTDGLFLVLQRSYAQMFRLDNDPGCCAQFNQQRVNNLKTAKEKITTSHPSSPH